MSESFQNAFVKNFLKVLTVILIVGLFLFIMFPFMISITLGGILAMALIPVVDYLERKGIKREKGLLLMCLSFAVIALVPVALFIVHSATVITGVMRNSDFSSLTNNAIQAVYKIVDKVCGVYGIDKELAHEKLTNLFNGSIGFMSKQIGNFMGELPTVLLVGFITSLSMYFFLRESKAIREFFDKYFYFSKKNGERFISMVKTCCQVVFISNIVTGILQALIVSTGSLIFGVGEFFVVFFITFVFSFIPVIGAGPVAIVLALMCFFDNATGSGIGLLVVAAIAGLSDNLLRPYLSSRGDVEVHPFLGFMAVIGGVIVFGLAGLFIGPLIASMTMGAVPIILEEFLPNKKEE